MGDRIRSDNKNYRLNLFSTQVGENKKASGSQPIVCHPNNSEYGLFYWVFLNKDKNRHINEIRTACSQIHQTAQQVDDPGLIAGIGFSSNVWQDLHPNDGHKIKPFQYRDWECAKQPACKLLATGGDIFVHAKANSVKTLYKFLHMFRFNMPPKIIDEESTTCVLGFTNGGKDNKKRDLFGFIVGTDKPEHRHALAVTYNGGSFAITQRWEHQMEYVLNPNPTDVLNMEDWIGTERQSGNRLHWLNKPEECPHVHRMQANNIVRQSLSFSETTMSGLFFLAFAKDTAMFDALLNEMTRDEGDMIFNMSTNVSGAYWYFPGMAELAQLGNN